MQFGDHLPPHFHAVYGEFEAQFAIADPRVLAGMLPPRALGLVMEWAAIHRDELRADWELAVARQELYPIEPLR